MEGGGDERTPLYGDGQTLADYYNFLHEIAMQHQPQMKKRRRRPKIFCEDVPSSVPLVSSLPVCHYLYISSFKLCDRFISFLFLSFYHAVP